MIVCEKWGGRASGSDTATETEWKGAEAEAAMNERVGSVCERGTRVVGVCV